MLEDLLSRSTFIFKKILTEKLSPGRIPKHWQTSEFLAFASLTLSWCV
jgi:hypothetical protein